VQSILERSGLAPAFFAGQRPVHAPPEAEAYLQPSNPRLLELREAYRALQDGSLTHSRWSAEYVRRDVPLLSFRSDCAYVWQRRDLNGPMQLALTAYYLLGSAAAPYLRLGEDSLFGADTISVGGALTVSRDLLDSASELWFLDRFLGLRGAQDFTVLDIGSGYGRFAHRLVRAFPGVEALCVDAIAESTFLCEYYLRFRGVESRARVIPFPDAAAALAARRVEVAVNIHSFSECTLQSIVWWLDLLRAHRVKHLMIAPNAQAGGGRELLSWEEDGSRRDFAQEIRARGYRPIACEPKYADPLLQRYGVTPTHYFLFELA